MAWRVEVWRDGEVVGVRPLAGRLVVGRDPARCDVVVDAEGVSKVHAEVHPHPRGMQVRDLGSKNGLKVDGERVSEAVVGEGKQVQVGTVALRLAAVAEAPWRWAARQLASIARGSQQARLEALVDAVADVSRAPDVWAVRWQADELIGLASASGDLATVPPPGRISRSIVADVAASGRPWWADDAHGQPEWEAAGSVQGLRSVGCLPLGPAGALFLSDRRGAGRFGASCRERVEALCFLASQVIDLPAQAAAEAPSRADGLVGTGPAMASLFDRLEAFAPFPYAVLLLGERGTGKTHLAEALHRLSGRDGAFVHVNAATLAEGTAESTLFGHEAGAFTGAGEVHLGWVEQASGGTLFLDEVGDLPDAVQAKLLVLLDRGTFRRVGGETERRFEGRIVAATNRPIDQGSMRRDLYDRLAQVVFRVPSLDKHPQDIPALAQALRTRELARLGLPGGPGWSEAALWQLGRRQYPGRNVRGLEADVRQALVAALHRGARQIEVADLPEAGVVGPPGTPTPSVPVAHHGQAMRDYERALLEAALAAHDGHQTKAREALGLSHGAWYRAKARVGLT